MKNSDQKDTWKHENRTHFIITHNVSSMQNKIRQKFEYTNGV
jgi:hypothetical protein